MKVSDTDLTRDSAIKLAGTAAMGPQPIQVHAIENAAPRRVEMTSPARSRVAR